MVYAPLHTHTEHSALDGMAKLRTLCQRGAELGMNSMAITDHHSLDGLWKFAQAAKKAGIKPIPGVEAYMAIGSRFEQNEIILPRDDDEGMGDAEDDDDESEFVDEDGKRVSVKTKTKRFGHLTILARNRAGWHNLIRFVNRTQDSFWYKPRGDMELLAECGDGLMVLTGCLAGPVAGPLSRVEAALDEGDTAKAAELRLEAKTAVEDMIKAVGRDYVFLEIMDHGIGAEDRAMEEIIDLADELNLPLVATNDSHFQDEEDAHGHDGFLCVGTKAQLDQPGRFKFNGSGYWLKSEAEMLAVRPDDDKWIEAVNNSQMVADLVDEDTVPQPQMLLPKYPIPAGFKDSGDYLRHLAEEGAHERCDGEPDSEVWDRIDDELKIINDMGFPDYFLIVWDFLAWCSSDKPIEFDNPEAPRKKPIILGLGRGSAAGSYVSYVLRIVGVDPLKYGLLFERFLEPGREGMPDIDMDIPATRRTEAFAYLIYRWGRENCARIGSYGVAKTKEALQDAARVLKPFIPKKATSAEAKRLMIQGSEYTKVGETISAMVPQKGESPYSFAKIDDQKDPLNGPFWDAVEKGGARAEEILELARAFEDTAKSPGIHPCGFVVSPVPLESLVPLRRASHAKDADPNAPLIIGWDGKDCEDFGLLKMDVLGLMNLDIAAVALDYIEETTGERIEFENLPDPETKGADMDAAWSLLAHGKTEGIFQSESRGMTGIIQNVKPHGLEDMSVVVATYRPGPIAAGVPDHYARRKNGLEEVEYSEFTTDPTEQKWIAKILGETQGLFLYQEQLMQLGTVIAGFDASQKSLLRAAVGKKDKAKMDQVGELLRAGAAKEFHDAEGNLISPVFDVKTAERTFKLMQGSADYLFNKCISAETVLYSDRGSRWTVEDLYSRLHGFDDVEAGLCPNCNERPAGPVAPRCLRCRSWMFKFNDDRGFTLLAFDESDGRIRPQRVKDVHRNGVKDVFNLILADGKEIRATGNHRFRTPSGYKTVDELLPGMSLITHGGYDRDWDQTVYRTTKGPRLQKKGNKPWLPGQSNSGFVDGGSVKLREWTELTRPTAKCDECDITLDDGRLERAHLDGDRTNNEDSNLAWKCVSHHKAYDYKHNGRNRRWDKGHLAIPVEILSIEPDGQAMTYDVEMAEGSDHNFVANGIISHNSHSSAYGYLAYLTAYMKANWPVEYGAAILAVADKAEKRRPALASLARDGIEVRTPSVNRSRSVTAPDGDVVVLGLGEIKDVGSVAAHIVAEREAEGPFESIHDLVSRVKVPSKDGKRTGKVNTQALNAMAEAGALDEFGPRMGLAQIVRGSGGHELPVPEVEWDIVDRAARQRLRLGVHLGEPVLPLIQEEILDEWRTPDDRRDGGDPAKRLGLLTDKRDKSPKLFAILTDWSERNSRNGRMANATLEDGDVVMDAVIFPDAFKAVARTGYKPAVGDVVCVSGTVRTRTIEVGDEENPEQMTVRELAVSRMWRVHVPQTPSNEALYPEVGFADLYDAFGPGNEPDGDPLPTKTVEPTPSVAAPEPAEKPEPQERIVIVTNVGGGAVSLSSGNPNARVLVGEVPDDWSFVAKGVPFSGGQIARFPQVGMQGVVLMWLDVDELPSDLSGLLPQAHHALEVFELDDLWKIGRNGAGVLQGAVTISAQPHLENEQLPKPVLVIDHADGSLQVIEGELPEGWMPDYQDHEVFDMDVVCFDEEDIGDVLVAIAPQKPSETQMRELLATAAASSDEWLRVGTLLFFAPIQELSAV